MECLAIDGGPRAIPDPLPGGPGGGAGVSLIGDEEVEAATSVLRSGRLFRFHPDSQVRAFEREAAAWIGIRHTLMVNSGTSALICALSGLGVGPGDEVIVPGYTYIATPAAVAAVGAVPVIAEIDESLGLDPEDVASKVSEHTRAIVPVHMQGVPCKLDALNDIATRRNLFMVEDCCQCIGGRYHGRVVGSFGDAAAWSLNYFKIITCGEGGLTFTNSDLVHERACFEGDPALPMWMRDTIPADGWLDRPFSTQCYRPSELLGAIARAQLRKLDRILAHTRELKHAFLQALGEPRCYSRQVVDDPNGDCGISAAIIVRDRGVAQRFAEALTAEGLPCGAAHSDGFPDRHIFRYWDSILERNAHHPQAGPWAHPAYRGTVQYSQDMCPRTLDILSRALRFGFNMHMTTEHSRLMANAINKVDAALA
ncbi:MAG: aminotransferase class I/II-fold pyridoxal phosphate-dependent enzyme [Armatimonadetes bacterium]|nr:aminotransferase class I/II-fold pyridoxal phosphate-dependent enzyme [Armatimonadota bacterium]